MQLKSFNWKRTLPWGLLLISMAFSVWLIYCGIDQAVTLDHQTQQNVLLREQRDILRHLAEFSAKDMTKIEFLNLLQEHRLEYFAKDEGKDRMIVAGMVVFHFKNDKLVSIEL